VYLLNQTIAEQPGFHGTHSLSLATNFQIAICHDLISAVCSFYTVLGCISI